jgi:hypothetical protein
MSIVLKMINVYFYVYYFSITFKTKIFIVNSIRKEDLQQNEKQNLC